MGEALGGLGGAAAGGSSVFDTGTSGLTGLTSGGGGDLFSSLLGGGGGGGGSFGDFGGSGSVFDALNSAYGFGDPTGSSSAQYALGQGDQGPTAMGTAQDTMQGAQQTSPQDAQTAMDQQLQQFRNAQDQVPQDINKAYGQDLFQIGGSQQAPAGPSGWKVAGPPDTPRSFSDVPADRPIPPAAGAALSQGMQQRGFDPYSSGVQRVPGAFPTGGTAGVTAPGMMGPAQATDYTGSPSAAAVGAPTNVGPSADPTTQASVQQAYGVPQLRPSVSSGGYTQMDAAASPAPASSRVAAAPAATTDASTTAAATEPSTSPTTGEATGQPSAGYAGAYQNPMQQIMQALGMGQLPQPLQQLVQQFLRQLFPGLQQMAQAQPFGGGSAMSPFGKPWNQIPWAPGWDPAQQQRGVPWKEWQPYPTSTASRSPSESGAPTALPPGSSDGSPAARLPVPANPPPVIRAPRDTAQASSYQVAANDVPQTPEDMLNRLRQMRQSVPPSGHMSPEDLRRRLQDIQQRSGRPVVAQADRPPWSPNAPIRNRAQSTALSQPPPGMSSSGQRLYRRMQEKINDPNATPEERAQAAAQIDAMEANPSGKGMLRDWGLR